MAFGKAQKENLKSSSSYSCVWFFQVSAKAASITSTPVNFIHVNVFHISFRNEGKFPQSVYLKNVYPILWPMSMQSSILKV